MKSIHDALVAAGAASDVEKRGAAFGGTLARAMDGLCSNGDPDLRGAVVVISGMVSSTVGWRELPYSNLPCGLDGQGIRVESLGTVTSQASGAHRVLGVSGLATERDILRGEETELLGLMALPGMAKRRGSCVVVLPGTHSKHLRVAGGLVVDFRTFMTGELMEVLAQHSLLKASLAWPPAAGGAESVENAGALAAGVAEVRARGLEGSLFRVRSRSVLDGVRSEANSWFLTGIVVGSEMLALQHWVGEEAVVLAASGALSRIYRRVLAEFDFGTRVEIVEPETLRDATVRAHALLLGRVESEMSEGRR